MANHIHVHIHRAPTRDRAPVARTVRSIGRDQHAPEDVSQLVGVLMQIIAEKEGTGTRDAEFDESKHKRDSGGRFTAGGMNAEQHQAAAAAKRQKGEEALKASDTQSAVKHITESQAHEDVSRALGAADMSFASPGGDYKQHLKQAASHFARTAAKATAGGMNAEQHKAAAKEHRDILGAGKSSEKSGRHHANAAMHHESAAFALEDGATSQAEAHANHAAHHKAEAAKIDEAHAITAHESRSGSASASSKPTSTTAKHIKPALHELFSSGHPFSVDELCKITGVTNPKLMAAYVTDMKNPKYAGKLGALEIVKRPDGMYHAQKKEGAGLAPKPGPDGQLMGKHPELAASERRVAENPRTTEVRHASGPAPALGDAKHKQLQKAHEAARNSYEMKRYARRAKGQKGVMGEAESKAYHKMNAAARALDDHERAARGSSGK